MPIQDGEIKINEDPGCIGDAFGCKIIISMLHLNDNGNEKS